MKEYREAPSGRPRYTEEERRQIMRQNGWEDSRNTRRMRTPSGPRKEDIRRTAPPAGARGRKTSDNHGYRAVSVFFLLLFTSMIVYLGYFNVNSAENFINSPYNTRQDTFSDRVSRGPIVSSDGYVLAETVLNEENGQEVRRYPYGHTFAHAVGYDSNGKSGLESEANFHLLSSHDLFLNQMKNEFKGIKNMGDTVVSTLNYTLQTTAYEALGDRSGAVVAIQPSTGRILAMVSKPDFDPNTLAVEWDSIINDETNSSLLNRSTYGLYPPGSTFKVVTALDYYREKRSLQDFSYECAGSITENDHTITCYNGSVHGQENLASAFASSCNCAFAEIGLELGGTSLQTTAQSLLFNKDLPYKASRHSHFELDDNSGKPLTMQTSIGQGNTLVSPMHMAMITCAIANGGELMKPYMIEEVRNNSGELVDKTEPSAYGNLMTRNEADILSQLMLGVVQNGTASSLSGRSYAVAGKTGSAEYTDEGNSHSWFIGYSSSGNADLVVAIIVEDGGTGSAAAVPIAGALFDAYYNNAIDPDNVSLTGEKEQLEVQRTENYSNYGEDEWASDNYEDSDYSNVWHEEYEEFNGWTEDNTWDDYEQSTQTPSENDWENTTEEWEEDQPVDEEVWEEETWEENTGESSENEYGWEDDEGWTVFDFSSEEENF